MKTTKTYFSVFDQFPDMTVDLTSYITRFSVPDNQITFSNMQPVVMTLKNLFEQVKLADDFKKNNLIGFENYTIADGERIETVAFEIYGSVEYWWILAMFNQMSNIFNMWPMTNDQLINLATKLESEEGKYPFDSYFRILFEKNESKRKISYLKNAHLGAFVWDIRKKIIEKNNEGITI